MPLNSVLFPGMPMPLVLFEDRYLRMARECLDEGSRFGVVLIREGPEVGGVADASAVGTTAEIVHSQSLGEAMAVLVVGRERFRVDRVEEDNGLLRAAVEVMDPAGAGEDVARLGEEMRYAFHSHLALMLELLGDPSPVPEVPSDPERLSYMIAAHLTCDLAQRQELLETDDTAHRLRLERELLREETEQFRVWVVATRRAQEVQHRPEGGGLLSVN